MKPGRFMSLLIIVNLMIETLLDLWGRLQSFCCAAFILQVALKRCTVSLLVSLHTVLTATCSLLQSLTPVSLVGDVNCMWFLLYTIRICMCWTKKLSSSLFKLSDSVIAGFIYSLSGLCFFCLYLKSFATLFCLPLMHTYVSSCALLFKLVIFFSHHFFSPVSLCFFILCSLLLLPSSTPTADVSCAVTFPL